MIRRNKLFTGLLLSGLLGLAGSATAATLTVINKDQAGQGLNDATPATPVGGNMGTTRGEQARIVFEYAAHMWGAVLQSDGPIDIDARFSALQCNDAGIVLGSTGTNGYGRFQAGDVPPGAKPDLWYPGSLLNALTGEDTSPGTSEMTMSFNGALGTAACLPDGGWYFGLDGNTPAGKNNLLNVMLHEMGHGLGFAGRTSLGTGSMSGGYNDIYSSFVYDNSNHKAWGELTNAQRAASFTKDGMLVFRGPNVVAEAPIALGPPEKLIVTAPSSIAGAYDYNPASPPANADSSNFSGHVVAAVTTPINPTTDGLPTDGCLPFDNAAEVAGNIVLINRGTCSFDIKIANAIAAGATGAILANNVAGPLSPAITLALPTVTISNTDGATLRSGLNGLTVELGHGTGMAGTDAAGNVMIYAPATLAPGSTFSHYDVRLSPNALMEYAESSDLQGHIDLDLTPALYKDEGWKLNEGGQMLLTCNTGVPTWVPGGAVIGANVYATARNIAASAAHFGIYKSGMLAHAAELASLGLLSDSEATSLNACLSDAELHNQFNAWGNGVDDPDAPGDGGDEGDDAVELAKGVALGGQTGAAGSETLYKLEVPAGALGLTLRTFGGTGDVSIFVKIDGEPSATDNNYKSVHPGNNESVAVPRPAAGTYYVKVVGVNAYSGVSVQGSFIQP